MASSSVSQEDLENDFELSSRRTRIRTARARTVNPPTRIGHNKPFLWDASNRTGFEKDVMFLDGHPPKHQPRHMLLNFQDLWAQVLSTCQDTGGGEIDEGGGGEVTKTSESLNITANFPTEHDASPKPVSRAKEKRVNRCVPVRQPLTEHGNRANHLNKGKQQQRDRRKLREKRRSTGVVHLPSTEVSTGGSTGEDEDEAQAMTAETRRNTQQNELIEREPIEERISHKSFQQRRNKSLDSADGPLHVVVSPSDLEADDEDNQDFDSLNQSDSTVSSLVQQTCEPIARPRPGTPTGDSAIQLAERAQEENRRLLSLLEERDHKLATLETRVSQLQRETECLREENAVLIRAMASLATSAK